jgi:hypothetical protein
MPKPGIRMMTDSPRPKKRTGPIVRLEVGKAYTARKGSYLRVQFGTDAIYMVTQLPPVVTTSSIVQVLSPRGVALCNAADLRPCDEFRLEDEE